MSTQEADEKREKDFRAALDYYGIRKILAYKSDQGWYWELHCKCCATQNGSIPISRDAAVGIIVIGVTIVVALLNVFTDFATRW